jgi:3-isopropylmalate dehydrogenase
MNHQIGIIEGDGVGPEVVAWGRQVLEAVTRSTDLNFSFAPAPVGGTCFLESGKVLPEASLEILRGCQAVLKGPMGAPISKRASSSATAFWRYARFLVNTSTFGP